jgi:hypothetical protein
MNSENLENKEQINFLYNKTDLEKTEFHLYNSLNKDFQIISCHSLYSPNFKIDFEKRSNNKLTTYAWLNRNEINFKDIEYTKLNGLEISDRTNFIVGSIIPEEEEILYEKEQCFIFCKVIIGNSFIKVFEKQSEINEFILEEIGSNNALSF